eukprot:7379011-Lingulodinium_polyedra.AAC.1
MAPRWVIGRVVSGYKFVIGDLPPRATAIAVRDAFVDDCGDGLHWEDIIDARVTYTATSGAGHWP